MCRLIAAVAAALAVLTPAWAQYPNAGEQVFRSQCAACHRVDARNMVGPGLEGLFGRVSGTHPGFAYSQANKDKHVTWSEETLDPYLKSPRQVIPGTKMTYAGLADDQKRADLIAYLEQATKPGAGVPAAQK